MKNKSQKPIVKFFKQNSTKLAAIVAISTCCILASDIALATSFDVQVDKMNGLLTGKIKTFLVGGGTVIAVVFSVLRGSWTQAGGTFLLGVTLSLYLDWVAAGMKFAGT